MPELNDEDEFESFDELISIQPLVVSKDIVNYLARKAKTQLEEREEGSNVSKY